MGSPKKTKDSSEVESTESDSIESVKEIEDTLEKFENLSDDVSTDNFSSSDDSDDEVVLNRSGAVPGHWYDSEEHRGYDIYGKRVVKTLTSSKIEELLKNAEDPDRWRTVQDLQNEREVYLTDADIAIIRRLRSGLYPDGSMRDEDYIVEYDDEEHKLHPVRNKTYPKSRFLASKDESKEIRRLVKLIRSGKLKPRSVRLQKKPETKIFDIWAPAEDEEPSGKAKGPANLPAPKLPLPGHAESYHPPEEFLFTEEEKTEWLMGDESTRKTTFIPERFPSLRRVPWYAAFITERFSRCLDLYAVPRMLKKKMNVDPESLLPKLPQVSDLRPFPNTLAVEFIGHESSVKQVSPSPLGDYVASISSESARVWDSVSGKCIWNKSVSGILFSAIAWHPQLPILAVGDEEGAVHFIHIDKLGGLGPLLEDNILEVPIENTTNSWSKKEGSDPMLSFSYGASTPITCLSWHPKGNFIAITSAQSPAIDKSCCVVSLTTKKHVAPLKGKSQALGAARHVIFHPSKPYLVVAGCANIGIFDLKNQERVNLLNSGSQNLSSVAIHPAGEGTHVVASSLDCKVIWFDTEIRNKPWKNFRHHSSAARKVAVHSKAGDALPLMASAGDDKAVHVVYSKVYVDDADKNPLVIPVKKLNHPSPVRDCQWHPSLPWIFTACDDGIVRLWA